MTLPEDMHDVLGDFIQLQRMLEVGLDSSALRRAYRLAARLSCMVASSRWHSGNFAEVAAWYGTGADAARQAGDRAMEAWARAFQTRVWLYTGAADTGLATIRKVRRAVSPISPAASLWALDSEAQLLAYTGRSQAARATMDAAARLYERWQPHLTTSLFSYPESQHYRAAETVLAFGAPGRPPDGVVALRRTMRPGTTAHTLITLDEAARLLRDGEVSEACRLASDSLSTVPAALRGGMVGSKVGRFLAAVPPRYRHLDCVHDVRMLAASAS
jgi:hypothetical protein